MLTLLAPPVADAVDFLFTDETQTGGFFSMTAARSAEQILRALRLGSRTAVLRELDRDPLIFHVAQSLCVTLQFESILRSTLRLLVDSAASEYGFLLDFFHPPPPPTASSTAAAAAAPSMDGRTATPPLPSSSSSSSLAPSPFGSRSATPSNDTGLSSAAAAAQNQQQQQQQQHAAIAAAAQGLFALTFGLSLNAVLQRLEDHLFACNDAIGVLLMIRLVQQHQQVPHASARYSFLMIFLDIYACHKFMVVIFFVLGLTTPSVSSSLFFALSARRSPHHSS
jgi:hypothetical protein